MLAVCVCGATVTEHWCVPRLRDRWPGWQISRSPLGGGYSAARGSVRLAAETLPELDTALRAYAVEHGT